MFDTFATLPADPILGLMSSFRKDNRPHKIDLGVGVYKDEQGRTPVMGAVKEAERRLLATQQTKSYVGPAGESSFNAQVARLVLGEQLESRLQERRTTFQTPGGCGGLRLAAEVVQRSKSGATVYVSDPTWANHVPLLGEAGLDIRKYPYYDYAGHSIRFDEMMSTLAGAGPGDLVLLHGCCHNPCGADLNASQWEGVRDLALKNGFTPFVDLAYQGLGDGIDEDCHGLRLLADAVPELIIVSSCSKNFGLYRERTGALTILCSNAAATRATESQIASVARGIYSMPPDHGAAVVDTILNDTELRAVWEDELQTVRSRINGLRSQLAARLQQKGAPVAFDFIEREKGMFSFLGISVEQVQALISEFGIYMVDSSRINIAGINDSNIDYLTDSLISVLNR